MGVIHILDTGSQAYQFLELVAVSGEYPFSGLNLALGEGRYKEKIINELKEDGFIKSYYKDKIRGYRITAIAKKMLLHNNSDRFQFYLEGNAETNYRKSEASRRIRLHRMAEINALMDRCEVDIWRDSKPYIFDRRSKTRCPPQFNQAVYYSSREMKEIGLEAVKVKNSRAIGIVINGSAIYIIYHTGNNLMRWQYNSEMRMKAVISFLLKDAGIEFANDMENIKAIMVGSDMDIAYQLMRDNDNEKSCFRLDGSFQTMYYTPANSSGVLLLKILFHKELIQELKEILSTDLIKQDFLNGIEIDAVDRQGTPILYAFTFDMYKIARFQAALNLRHINGIIICFNFQSKALEKYCNHRITIQTIDSQKVERRFFSG